MLRTFPAYRSGSDRTVIELLDPPFRDPFELFRMLPPGQRVLLESPPGSGGRYSFVMGRPTAIFDDRHGIHSPEVLRRLLPPLGHGAAGRELPPFLGGFIGLLSYDLVRSIENLRMHTEPVEPLIHFQLVDRVWAYDHLADKLYLAFVPELVPNDEKPKTVLREMERLALGPPLPPLPAPHLKFMPDRTREEYVRIVRRCLDYIGAGDIFQANISHRFTAAAAQDEGPALYAILRALNPSPFSALFETGAWTVVCGSPERLIRVRGEEVVTRPIAGTRPRGGDPERDAALEQELLANEKERAEHLMLLDLERNDLGRVCRPGSVRIDELMTVERYSHVMHLVSNVRGGLRAGVDTADLIRATFPGGTITGVPKVRCMEIIDELEAIPRGPYTGSIGYFGFGGEIDLNIVIRTILLRAGRAYLQVGAGIVADSVPEWEYDETIQKARALLTASDLGG